MRPPEFWRADVGGRDAALAIRALLTPASWLYQWAVAQRIRSTLPRHAPTPVLCIGNFTVGGAGKTPIARALRAKLGPHAHTLSRGYGGRVAGPLRVTTDMDAREVGDEPLLHATDGPAWIARDRFAGAQAAAQAGAHVIIMDDGFQNPTLAKDLCIVAVDAEYGVGNGSVFPAGPLRERLSDGLKRADAIIMMHGAEGAEKTSLDLASPHWLSAFSKPILHASLSPLRQAPAGKLIAFAGLARPEKFFDTLVQLGAELEETVPFADHHPYSSDDLVLLARLAEERDAQLITTEKDAVRLSPEWRARVATLPVVAKFENEGALDALLAPIQSRIRAAYGET